MAKGNRHLFRVGFCTIFAKKYGSSMIGLWQICLVFARLATEKKDMA